MWVSYENIPGLIVETVYYEWNTGKIFYLAFHNSDSLRKHELSFIFRQINCSKSGVSLEIAMTAILNILLSTAFKWDNIYLYDHQIYNNKHSL